MSLTLTIAALRAHHACDLAARIADLRRVLPDAPEDIEVPLATWWALPSTSVADRVWSLRAVSDAERGQRIAVTVASRAARRVLPLAREPSRGVCLAAIEAAEAWAAHPTPDRQHVAAACARHAAERLVAGANRAANGYADITLVLAVRAGLAAINTPDAACALGFAAYATVQAADYIAAHDERARQCADLDALIKE